MSKVILHIGTHKTATTTIQDTFFRNRALLARHGVIYPKLGRAAGHHGLVLPWFDLAPVYKIADDPLEPWRRLNAEFGKQDVTLFLSTEELSRGRKDGRADFAQIRELLSDFDEFQVICTLRHQSAFMQSIFLEISKKHRAPQMANFLSTAQFTNMVTGVFLDYNDLYDHVRKGFAPEEILFLSFDEARAHPDGILGCFTELLGAGVPYAEMKLDVDSNVSPDPLSAWVAGMVAGDSPAPKPLLDLTGQVLTEMFGPGKKTTLFTKLEAQEIHIHFRQRNARLTRRLQEVQPGFTVPQKGIGGELLYRNRIDSDYWARLARVLYAR